MSKKQRTLAKVVPFASFVVLFAIIGGLLYALMAWVGDQEPSKKKTIQQVTIIAPPPPPPPPPKVEEPPPEVEEVEIEEPDPTPEDIPDMAPDDVPPGEQLGLDADGTGGGDAFGLVGKKGGRGLLGGGDPYAWYSSSIQQKIFEVLNETHSIRKASYSIVVHFWISPSGMLENFKLAKGSGKDALDDKISLALADIKELEPPVPGMPQPVKVRLTARL